MSYTVEFNFEDGFNKALSLSFECSFNKGTPDYFSASHGNWLPGEPDEITVDSVMVDGDEVKGEVARFFEKKFYDVIVERVLILAEAA